MGWPIGARAIRRSSRYYVTVTPRRYWRGGELDSPQVRQMVRAVVRRLRGAAARFRVWLPVRDFAARFRKQSKTIQLSQAEGSLGKVYGERIPAHDEEAIASLTQPTDSV